MTSSLLTYLLLTAVADPAAAAPPAVAVTVPVPTATTDRRSGSVIVLDHDDDGDMAIDELGMPVDKKDKKGKPTAVTASSSSSSSCTGSCPAPAGMAINEKGTAGTVKAKPKSNK